jgi:outer membrane protein assembly factor BamB
VALIELDLYAPVEPAPIRIPPAHRYRYAALVVAAVLVLVLGGAAPASSALWRLQGQVPLTTTDGMFKIAGERLYAFETTGTDVVTTAWSLGPARRLWSRADPVPALGPNGRYLPEYDWNVQAVGDDEVLLTANRHTSLLDARTGATRWSTPLTVTSLLGSRVGLAYDEQFRPGTEYDETGDNAGPMYISSAGTYTEPAVRTTVRALDLNTGRQLWARTVTGQVDGQTLPTGASRLLLITADRLTLIATGTGAVLHERRLTGSSIAGQFTADAVVGDLVLVRSLPPDRPGGLVSAYSADDLVPVWQRAEPGDTISAAFCRELLCTAGDDGTTVLDPATGAPRWQVGGDAVSLLARGPDVVEWSAQANRATRILDAVTGSTRLDLEPWSFSAFSDTDQTLVLGRYAVGRTVFGILRPGRYTVQPLGYLTTAVTECSAADRFVACRSNTGVEVWSYLP